MSAQPCALTGLGTPSVEAKRESFEQSIIERLRDQEPRQRLPDLIVDPSSGSGSVISFFTVTTPHLDTTSWADVLRDNLGKTHRLLAAVYLANYQIRSETLTSGIITEIDRLKAGREDEVIPTDFAYKAARSILEAAYSKAEKRNVPTVVPEPWLTTDDVGGIRALWNFGLKKLRANFGARPELRTYLYYESEHAHDAEALNANSLESRLNWLTER